MSVFAIRAATENDAPALVAVLNPIIAAGRLARRQPVTEAEQRDYIRNFPSLGVLLVACDAADRVVGLQSASAPDRGAGDSFTFVAMDQQRLGVGRALTAAMFSAARDKGCRTLRASIPNGNPWALAFYYAMDFRHVSGDWPGDIIVERSTEVIALTPLQVAVCDVLAGMRLSGIDEATATAAYGAEAVVMAKTILKDAIDAPVDWRRASMDEALLVLKNLLGKRYPWLTVKARAYRRRLHLYLQIDMPDWFPISRFGAVLAALYAVGAILVVAGDRAPGGGGGWISLTGMASYLATIPVSLPFEMLGQKLDYKRNLDMGFAILVCSVLVYLAGAGVAWIISQIVHAGRA